MADLDLSKPRPVLKELTVPPERLSCAEYCFNVTVDFNEKPNKDRGVSYLKKVLTALLNTSGGLIFINSTTSRRKLDSWKCVLDEALTAFIPLDVFRRCVSLREWSNQLVMLVKKSVKLITLKSNIYIRGLAGNREVNDIKSMQDIITQQAEQRAWTLPFQGDPIQYKTELNISEGPNIEFKCWKAVDIFDGKGLKDTYTKRLKEERTHRTLFAMPNMAEGGCLVLGVEEYKENNTFRVLGQIISANGEKQITKFIEEQLNCDELGYSRLWGKNKSAIRGRDWDIKFIEVKNVPTNDRRRVIEISFYHFAGGVFRQHPESYVVDETGYLVQMDTKEWFRQIYEHEVRIVPKIFSQTSHGNHTVTAASMTTDDSTQRILKRRHALSWTKHTKNWMEYINDAPIKTEVTSSQSLAFELNSPMTFTPDKEAILRSDSGDLLKNTLECIQQDSSKGFGIASSQWTSLFQIQNSNKRPEDIIMDIFTMVAKDERLVIRLWTSLKENTSELGDIWKYLFVSGRITKRNILLNQQFEKIPDFISSLVVECAIFRPDESVLSGYPGSNLDVECIKRFFLPSISLLRSLQCCLVQILSHKETRIRDTLGDGHNLKLTQKQMEIILNLGLDKFTYIEGPPGSGKSCLALYLCENNPCGYICTTPAFEKFLKYQNVQHVFLINSPDALNSFINDTNIDNLEYLVVDNVHTTSFGMDTWYRLFNCVATSAKTKLVLLTDSLYQSFNNGVPIRDYFLQYCQRNSYNFMHKVLSVVYRNDRKIVSYMKSNFSGQPDYQNSANISSARVEDGDDIELRVLSDVFLNESANSLVAFAKVLANVRGVLMNEAYTYGPKDIAILVDTRHNSSSTSEETPGTKVERLRSIFRRYGDAAVHCAGTFPVEGYTIDTVDNFVGLERRVCIFVSSLDIEESTRSHGRSLCNPRYRTFLASRAISRVVFVVSKLTPSIVHTFGLDNLPSAPERLWHHEKGKHVLDACFVEKGDVTFVLYTTESDEKIKAVSLDGNHYFNKTTGMKKNLWVTGSRSRPDHFIYCSCDDIDTGSCVWAVGSTNGDSFTTKSQHKLETRLQSIHGTTDGGVVTILYKRKEQKRTLVKYSMSDEQEMWHLDSNTTRLVHPGRVSLSKERDRLYVSDQGDACIRELTPHGEHIRDIPTHTIQRPRAICVDRAQKCLFVCDQQGGDVFQLDIYSGAPEKVLQCGDGEVFNLCLHEDRYLAVASSDGVALYDLGA